MDPDTALEFIISALSTLSCDELSQRETVDTAADIVERVEALRDWLLRGGYQPSLIDALERNFGTECHALFRK